MNEEPRPPQEKNLNPTKVIALVDELLHESSQHDVDCLDLKDELVCVILEWFQEKKKELEESFKDFYPQSPI